MLRIPAGKTHLTAREAATYTDRHINTIRLWITEGKIAASRVGNRGHYTIPISQLDDALKYETATQESHVEMPA